MVALKWKEQFVVEQYLRGKINRALRWIGYGMKKRWMCQGSTPGFLASSTGWGGYGAEVNH